MWTHKAALYWIQPFVHQGQCYLFRLAVAVQSLSHHILPDHFNWRCLGLSLVPSVCKADDVPLSHAHSLIYNRQGNFHNKCRLYSYSVSFIMFWGRRNESAFHCTILFMCCPKFSKFLEQLCRYALSNRSRGMIYVWVYNVQSNVLVFLQQIPTF